MTDLESDLLSLLDDIEMVADDECVVNLTQTRFDIVLRHGYTIEFDPNQMLIH